MSVERATSSDLPAWIGLAREVEPLFGPMADEPGFRQALEQAITQGAAFRLAPESRVNHAVLKGGVVISRPANEIAWLAVAGPNRGQGGGRELLAFALAELDGQREIVVQTFDPSVPQGRAARSLYLDFGFLDHEPGGLNPAGLPTVLMRLAPGYRASGGGRLPDRD